MAKGTLDAPDAVTGVDRVDRALALAYRYLNRRERTEAEMRRQLERNHVEKCVVEDVIRLLVDQRIIDDERYVRLFIEDKRRLEQWGEHRIAKALLERGIARELVTAGLSAHDDAGELERAVALLSGRFRSPPQTSRERDRALGMLVRRGYASELALAALAAHARSGEDDSVA